MLCCVVLYCMFPCSYTYTYIYIYTFQKTKFWDSSLLVGFRSLLFSSLLFSSLLFSAYLVFLCIGVVTIVCVEWCSCCVGYWGLGIGLYVCMYIYIYYKTRRLDIILGWKCRNLMLMWYWYWYWYWYQRIGWMGG